jgi:hypothetical protein
VRAVQYDEDEDAISDAWRLMRRYLALLVLSLAAAPGCGEIKTVAGGDGGAGSDGAPPTVDAGNPGDPLNGTWHWWIGDEVAPDSTCDVTIGGGEFEVYCPSPPYEITADCTRTKNDTRILGTWGAAFAGRFDQIERYEGTGCAAADHPDTDVDIVTEGVLVMEADLATDSTASGFLPEAFGQWDWSMSEAEAPDPVITCAVTFEPGADAETAAFHVECQEPPETPIADCTQIDAIVIEGTIDAATMTGEGWDESRYDGVGCAPTYPDPVVVDGEPAPMGATHE